VALVDQLVVGRIDAALVDAKHVFIRSVCEREVYKCGIVSKIKVLLKIKVYTKT